MEIHDLPWWGYPIAFASFWALFGYLSCKPGGVSWPPDPLRYAVARDQVPVALLWQGLTIWWLYLMSTGYVVIWTVCSVAYVVAVQVHDAVEQRQGEALQAQRYEMERDARARFESSLAQLVRSGRVHQVLGTEVVVCANGHKQSFGNFQFFDGHDYHTESRSAHHLDKYGIREHGVTHYDVEVASPVYTFGCKGCKTDLYTFVDPRFRDARFCQRCRYLSLEADRCLVCSLRG